MVFDFDWEPQKEESQKSENTIVGDKFDEKEWQDIMTNSHELQKDLNNKKERLQTVQRLAEDVFRALYKNVPQVMPEKEIAPSHLHNRSIVEKAMGTKEYDELRSYTRLEPVESAIATRVVVNKAIESIPKGDLEKMNQQAQQAQNLQDRMEKLMNSLSGLSSLEDRLKNNPPKKMTPPQIQAKMQALQNAQQQQKTQLGTAQQQMQGLQQEITQTGQNMGEILRGAVRQGLKSAQDDVKGYDDFVVGWGFGKGQAQTLPVEEKMMLARKLADGKLRRIAQIVGRMKRLAIAKHENKIKKEPSEIVDITMGRDLSNTLPSEFLHLAEPVMEVLFFKKLIGGELLQYEMESKEKVAKGPIVVCCDDSGSMSGEREIWSKAMTIGLLEIAIREKRRFACIHFGDRDDPIDTTIIEPTEDPTERVRKIIHIGEYFLGGGTDFEKPIEEAVRIIELQPSFKKADIVFVTDGACRVRPEWLENFKKYKKEKEVKMLGINIGGYAEVLETMCEKVINHAELVTNDVNVASEVYEFI